MPQTTEDLTKSAFQGLYESAMKAAENSPEIGEGAQGEGAGDNDLDELGLPVDGGEIPSRPEVEEEEDTPEEESSEESQESEVIELTDDTIVTVKIDGEMVQKKFGEVRSDFAGREMISRKSQELSEKIDFLNRKTAELESIIKNSKGEGGEEKPGEPKTRLKRFSIEDFGVNPADPLVDHKSMEPMIERLNEQQEHIEKLLEYVDFRKEKEFEAESQQSINETTRLIEEASKSGTDITTEMTPLVFGLIEMAKMRAKAEPGKGWEKYGAQHAIKDVQSMVGSRSRQAISRKDIPKEVIAEMFDEWKEAFSGKEPDFNSNKSFAESKKKLDKMDKSMRSEPLSVEGGIFSLNERVRNSYKDDGEL